VSAARQKKGIFGLHRAKAGQQHVPHETVAELSFAKFFAYRSRRCQGIDRCHEPAGCGIRGGDSPAGREIREEAPITTS
jgi:hypothetical protein